ITATQDDKTSLSWPALKDKIGKSFDIVKWSKPDTVFSDNKSTITYSQEYILTSFDSGYQVIPSLRFFYTKGNETLYVETDSIPVLVNTVPVDTSKGFYDITSPVDAPFSIREILPHIIVGVSVVIIGVLLFFLINYLR